MPQTEYDPQLVAALAKGFKGRVEDYDDYAQLDADGFTAWLVGQGWQAHLDGKPDTDVDDEIASAWSESAEVVDDENGDAATSADAWEVVDRLRQRGILFARVSA